jgi:hypothetical protein
MRGAGVDCSQMHTEADRDKARLHVAEGEARVERQIALVHQMAAAGYPIRQAVGLLETFEISLDAMRRHLAEIERDLTHLG